MEYSVKIIDTNLELTTREKLKYKDLGNAVQLDELMSASPDGVVLTVKGYVKLAVHNEKSDTVDYYKLVLVTADGAKYCTGSAPFEQAFMGIVDEWKDCGEEWPIDIEVYTKPSKNYKGKSFLSCSIA